MYSYRELKEELAATANYLLQKAEAPTLHDLSFNFLCQACGFSSNTVADVERHMKNCPRK